MANNNDSKNIKYLNKTFSDFKATLIEYAKTYFSNTFNDFSESDPGFMFIEMAAYVGDVLSFYLDTQTQETLLIYAKEKENLMALAYALGYRPKVTYASSTTLDIYQLIPTTTINSVLTPDLSFGLIIPQNTIVTSNSTGLKFLTSDKIDFTNTGSATINFVDSNYFLFKKSVNVISGEIKTTTSTFGSPIKFNTISISDTNIIQILDIKDTDNNEWYEVSYLAQATLPIRLENTPFNNPNFTSNDSTPYILRYRNIPRRFTARFKSDNTLELQFGAGITNSNDEEIIPNPDNVGLGTIDSLSKLDQIYNKPAALFTKQYGLAPSNTTLTIRYLVGGGITSNVPSNDLLTLDTSNIFFKNNTSNPSLNTTILNSISCTNISSSRGGRDGDTIEEIRLNTLHSHTSQLRAVTKQDYIIRALSMPSDFGAIAKAYITNVEKSTLDLYMLAYDSNKNLVTGSALLKQNLKNYINQYRIITDTINIKDAYYINIGVNFDISIISGFNGNEVLTNCINSLTDYFNIDKWQINQPIITSELYTTLFQIKGVQSIIKIQISNIQGGNYSQFGYDIQGATRNSIIYPSLDPSIFEVKYPSVDIQGRIISL